MLACSFKLSILPFNFKFKRCVYLMESQGEVIFILSFSLCFFFGALLGHSCHSHRLFCPSLYPTATPAVLGTNARCCKPMPGSSRPQSRTLLWVVLCPGGCLWPFLPHYSDSHDEHDDKYKEKSCIYLAYFFRGQMTVTNYFSKQQVSIIIILVGCQCPDCGENYRI